MRLRGFAALRLPGLVSSFVHVLHFLTSHLLFPDLLHPLFPLFPHDERGAVVRLSPGESCSKDRRAFGADGRSNGHEEAARWSADAPNPVCKSSRWLNIPESGCRADHVLAQRAHHAVRSRAEADDVGCAKDEADDQADSCIQSQIIIPIASHAFERYVLPPIMPPIFTARVLAAKHGYMELVKARILLSKVDWPPAPPPGTAATGGILVVC
jgi:hypothetical protein